MCKAMQENYEEGRADGRAEGRVEGRAEGRADVALELLREGDYSPEKIARLCSLPLCRIMKLKRALKRE